MDKNLSMLKGILLQLNVTQATRYTVQIVLCIWEKANGILKYQLAT